MPESQNTPRDTSPNLQDHAITIVDTVLSTGPLFRASCLCGYLSPTAATRGGASSLGRLHTRHFAAQRAGETR